MKNKYFSFVALAAAALATSCASDDLAEQKQEQNQNGTRTVTLTASVNDVQTRVGMTKNDSKASFYWHNGDKIFVQTKGSDNTYSGAEFTTTVVTGQASATFTGTVASGNELGTYAVYPYNESHKFTDKAALTYNLPASYTGYTPESKIFGSSGDYPSNPTNMPMLGTISGKSISFKCLGGLAVIRVASMPVTEGTLTVTADQQLSGDFTVSDLSSTTTPEITTTTGSDDNKKVSFTFSGATANGVGVFYLPLATGSYTNVRVEIKDKSSNTWWMSNNSTLTITRTHVTAVSLASTDMGKIVKNTDGTYTINCQYTFKDLGLSVLWATKNIGADTETAAGGYFSWGETSTKSSYKTADYKYGKNPATLPAENDAATANWGAGVRMPTRADFQELINGSTISSGSNSFIFTGKDKYSSQSVSLPAVGLRNCYDGNLVNTGSCYYWTSSFKGNLWNSDYACALQVNGVNSVHVDYNDQYGISKCASGLTVRAVADKPTTTE